MKSAQLSMDRNGLDRRNVLAMSLLGGLAAAGPVSAADIQQVGPGLSDPARPPAPLPAMPIVDARYPAEIAPGVFVLPDKRIPLVPNVGIIVGRDTVLVVDCGLGIESAENVLEVTRRLAPGRRIVLTVTHAHPEHGFGAQVFGTEGRIYYNRLQADYFARSGATLLAGFREGVLPSVQRQLLDGVVLTPPDETYQGSAAMLDLGGRKVAFRNWGTAHSPGDQTVHLQPEGIVFAGDLIEERMFPIVPLFPPMIQATDMDVSRWEVVLAEIIRMKPRLIVPGHGNFGGAEIAAGVIGYFKDVRAIVQTTAPQGVVPKEIIRAHYPTWENSQFIAPAIGYFEQTRS